jgi:hypothetical protein
MDEADDVLFEALYQDWRRSNGLTRPIMTEELERFVRTGGQAYAPTPCPHGKTMLTCNKCYFAKDGWGDE